MGSEGHMDQLLRFQGVKKRYILVSMKITIGMEKEDATNIIKFLIAFMLRGNLK